MQYQINYAGGMVAAQVFSSEAEMNAEKQAIVDYRAKWDEIKEALAQTSAPARAGRFGAFCPYLQWIHLSALKPGDEPGIPENGIYIDFEVNMRTGKVEITQNGHIYLTPEDQKKSYLCMCGIRQVVEKNGGKWFRKQAYKSPEDLARRLSEFWAQQVMPALENLTEGYPYKQMKVNIY